MVNVIPTSLSSNPWDEVARAARAAADTETAEAALREIVHAALRITGDGTAHERPGALNLGERHFSVAGAFMVSPDLTHHLLLAATPPALPVEYGPSGLGMEDRTSPNPGKHRPA